MTEPTWKDPLLAKWWEGCSEETKQYIEDEEACSVLTMLELLDGGSSQLAIFADRLRLRSLIDAELARGREAVEVLRECEWAASEYHEGDSTCPDCGCHHPASRLYDRSDVGHAPDCRLAKVISRAPDPDTAPGSSQTSGPRR